MKKERVVVECKQCGKTFMVPECRVWRSHYCSANCRILAREDRYKARQVVCSVCKETFTPRTTQIRAGLGKFCSHKCKGVAFSGVGNPFFGKTHTKQAVDRWRVAMENNGSWKYGDNHHGYKGGFIFRGYRILSVGGKIIPEHRLVAGATKPSQIVHHKDEEKLNNCPSNLEILSRAEHAAIHAKERENGRFISRTNYRATHQGAIK